MKQIVCLVPTSRFSNLFYTIIKNIIFFGKLLKGSIEIIPNVKVNAFVITCFIHFFAFHFAAFFSVFPHSCRMG